jgi:hypothetical protein
MIFVCYSHQDEAWRKRFEKISKPLARAEKMKFWSDRDIEAGDWERQIDAAMKEAVASVLMVSDNFLASDYIVQRELPYLIRAAKTRGLMIFWAYLEPCDIKRYPEIKRFQAMTLGELEQPLINRVLDGKSFPTGSLIPLLLKPARRSVEVLVYAHDQKWWRQAPVKAGERATKIHLGDSDTKKGAKYKIVAMTTERPLTERNYLSIPPFRRKSADITLVRA